MKQKEIDISVKTIEKNGELFFITDKIKQIRKDLITMDDHLDPLSFGYHKFGNAISDMTIAIGHLEKAQLQLYEFINKWDSYHDEKDMCIKIEEKELQDNSFTTYNQIGIITISYNRGKINKYKWTFLKEDCMDEPVLNKLFTVFWKYVSPFADVCSVVSVNIKYDLKTKKVTVNHNDTKTSLKANKELSEAIEAAIEHEENMTYIDPKKIRGE